MRERLLEEGGADAKQALDYLSEVGDEGERATAKFHMARTFAHLGAADQVANYVLEAAPLAGDGVSQSIVRVVSRASPAPDYLSEIENMIAAWEKHRSGDLEAFAHRLAEMGEGLTLRTFSETRLAFLKDAVESVSDAGERIRQRLQIAKALMELARWGECEELLRATLTEATSHADAQLVARASNNLGNLLRHAGRHGEAEPFLREALEVAEAAFGKHHPYVAACLNNLAVMLQDTNRHDEAEPMLREALARDEAAFGKHHPTAAIRLNNLAVLLQNTNRVEEAEPMLRRALALDEVAFDELHPTVAIDLNNLAVLLQNTNRHEEAEPMLRRALAIDVAAFGKHHPTVAIRLNNLAVLLQDTSRHEDAEPMFREALEIDEAAFGAHHPNVARRLNNLAMLLQNTNRNEEAEPLMRRALDILDSSSANATNEHPPVSKLVKANYQTILRAMAGEPD